MTRILFVDDDPAVLEGIRRALRLFRREWKLVFATDSSSALAQAEEGAFDVVVADLRMPGMDGVRLLAAFKARWPETVRIALSGFLDRRASAQLTGIVHQYLAKPCDPALLLSVVRRATQLRDRLTDESLLRLVSGISRLPSMPALYTEVMQLVQDADSTVADIASVVARDPAMTAKVLQLVNSSFFGLRRRVTDPVQAVKLIGLDNLASLVLGVGLFARLRRAGDAGLSVDRLYRDSLATAALCKAIAMHQGGGPVDISDYHLAGMLHDCGLLVMAANFPGRYSSVVVSPDDVLVAEHEALGATHEDVGAYLLGVWGLPDPVVEAAAFHHTPSSAGLDRPAPVSAVHVARAVLEWPDDPHLDIAHLEAIGVDAEEWVDVCRKVLSV